MSRERNEVLEALRRASSALLEDFTRETPTKIHQHVHEMLAAVETFVEDQMLMGDHQRATSTDAPSLADPNRYPGGAHKRIDMFEYGCWACQSSQVTGFWDEGKFRWWHCAGHQDPDRLAFEELSKAESERLAESASWRTAHGPVYSPEITAQVTEEISQLFGTRPRTVEEVETDRRNRNDEILDELRTRIQDFYDDACQILRYYR